MVDAKRLAGAIAIILALSLLVGCSAPAAAPEPAHPSASEQVELLGAFGDGNPSHAPLEEARLVRVVDGDTIVVDRGSGEEKVRMIGIDAPESVHPDASRNSQAGIDASSYLKAKLEGVATVYLERDVSDTDRYGRLLRYVWLQDPAMSGLAIEDNMLNAHMVSAGYAQAKDYAPDTKDSELLHALER